MPLDLPLTASSVEVSPNCSIEIEMTTITIGNNYAIDNTILFGTYLLIGQLSDAVDASSNVHLELSLVQIRPHDGRSMLIQSDHSSIVGFQLPESKTFHYFDVSDASHTSGASCDTPNEHVRTIPIAELNDVKLKFTYNPTSSSHRVCCSLNPDLTCHNSQFTSGRMHLVLRKRGVYRSEGMRELKSSEQVVFIYKLPASSRQIKQVTDILIDRHDGPALPRVLAELIVSYLA